MNYISTRGAAGRVTASEAIIKGLADDGGLFTPEHIPTLAFDDAMLKSDYAALAKRVLALYLTDFSAEEINECAEGAYCSGFDDAAVAPLKTVGDYNFLELFHGGTIAFKDMALSILPRLMRVAAKKLKIDKKIMILTATSGDTGKAALSAFAGEENFAAVVFYPHGGVSETQRLQMATQEGGNVVIAAVRGNFDHTQKGVKKIFADKDFNAEAEKKGVLLSSANSINIGRLIPQIVYYYYAYAQMVKSGRITTGEKINFAVPTGNFGNILAGWFAMKMGLPVGKLLCASNMNKVLYDFFGTGQYDANRAFHLTMSPSMDILVSSNLERLLFEISNGDAQTVAECMNGLQRDGKYAFNYKRDDFSAYFADEDETKAAVKFMYENGYVCDPHTAVACAALNKSTLPPAKTVILSTASPFKFADSVLAAVGLPVSANSDENLSKLAEISGKNIPPAVNNLSSRKVLHNLVIDEAEMPKIIKDFI